MKNIKMAGGIPVVPIIVVPTIKKPKSSITAGCVNKPGCNSQVIYVLPYMKKS